MGAGHVKVKLKKPIAFGDQTITELIIRDEVVAGDMRGIPMRDPMWFDDVLKLLGRLAAQPDPVINKLSFEDLAEVAPLVAGFIGGSPPTGTEP